MALSNAQAAVNGEQPPPSTAKVDANATATPRHAAAAAGAGSDATSSNPTDASAAALATALLAEVEPADPLLFALPAANLQRQPHGARPQGAAIAPPSSLDLGIALLEAAERYPPMPEDQPTGSLPATFAAGANADDKRMPSHLPVPWEMEAAAARRGLGFGEDAAMLETRGSLPPAELQFASFGDEDELSRGFGTPARDHPLLSLDTLPSVLDRGPENDAGWGPVGSMPPEQLQSPEDGESKDYLGGEEAEFGGDGAADALLLEAERLNAEDDVDSEASPRSSSSSNSAAAATSPSPEAAPSGASGATAAISGAGDAELRDAEPRYFDVIEDLETEMMFALADALSMPAAMLSASGGIGGGGGGVAAIHALHELFDDAPAVILTDETREGVSDGGFDVNEVSADAGSVELEAWELDTAASALGGIPSAPPPPVPQPKTVPLAAPPHALEWGWGAGGFPAHGAAGDDKGFGPLSDEERQLPATSLPSQAVGGYGGAVPFSMRTTGFGTADSLLREAGDTPPLDVSATPAAASTQPWEAEMFTAWGELPAAEETDANAAFLLSPGYAPDVPTAMPATTGAAAAPPTRLGMDASDAALGMTDSELYLTDAGYGRSPESTLPQATQELYETVNGFTHGQLEGPDDLYQQMGGDESLYQTVMGLPAVHTAEADMGGQPLPFLGGLGDLARGGLAGGLDLGRGVVSAVLSMGVTSAALSGMMMGAEQAALLPMIQESMRAERGVLTQALVRYDQPPPFCSSLALTWR